MPSRQAHLRLYVLLVLGGLLLHELRYSLAFGHAADAAKADHGHAYLSAIGPLLGVAATVGLGAVVLRAAAAGERCTATAVRLRRVWPLVSVGLFALFAGQELLEGALSPGHPAGVEGVLGNGGWVSLPLAAAIGGLVALTIRVVDDVAATEAPASGWLRTLVLRVPETAAAVPPGVLHAPAAAPLAGNRAGRAPPTPA